METSYSDYMVGKTRHPNRKAAMSGGCLLCDEVKTTREHVMSDWFQALLRDRGIVLKGSLAFPGATGEYRMGTAHIPLCHECNNVRMNKLAEKETSAWFKAGQNTAYPATLATWMLWTYTRETVFQRGSGIYGDDVYEASGGSLMLKACRALVRGALLDATTYTLVTLPIWSQAFFSEIRQHPYGAAIAGNGIAAIFIMDGGVSQRAADSIAKMVGKEPIAVVQLIDIFYSLLAYSSTSPIDLVSEDASVRFEVTHSPEPNLARPSFLSKKALLDQSRLFLRAVRLPSVTFRQVSGTYKRILLDSSSDATLQALEESSTRMTISDPYSLTQLESENPHLYSKYIETAKREWLSIPKRNVPCLTERLGIAVMMNRLEEAAEADGREGRTYKLLRDSARYDKDGLVYYSFESDGPSVLDML